jgi:hypothetical protein
MVGGFKGIGMRKHARSGSHRGNTKRPKFRHTQRLEAERNEIKDRSRIRDPKTSIKDLFKE